MHDTTQSRPISYIKRGITERDFLYVTAINQYNNISLSEGAQCVILVYLLPLRVPIIDKSSGTIGHLLPQRHSRILIENED